MALYNPYAHGNTGTADTQRGPSMNLWDTCPIKPWMGNIDPNIGWGDWDDFTAFAPIPFATGALQTTSGGIAGKYRVYCATAGTIMPDAMPHSAAPTTTAQGGILSALCDTAGDQASLQTLSCPYSLSTTLAGQLWFEARIATTSIATATTHMFVGLGENYVSAQDTDSPLGDADAVSAELALIGWNRLEDGLGVLNTSYADHAALYTHVQTSAGSIAAETFTKVGFYFNPQDETRCVRFFQNGVETSTAMTKAVLAALTHLDGKGLGLCWATYADTGGTAAYSYIDWWGCAQLGL